MWGVGKDRNMETRGSFSRVRSSLSAWLQDTRNKGNNAEIQARYGKALRRSGSLAVTVWFLAATAAVVTALPQLFAIISAHPRHTQFLYQISPKLPGAGFFLVMRGGRRRYNVLLGKDLDFP